MELKQRFSEILTRVSDSLNRTFYGIETDIAKITTKMGILVLIVPFMELKPGHLRTEMAAVGVLIVPFMELKLGFLRISWGS